MAASTSGRSLEQTPTWAVAVVCFVLVLISIIIEHILELIGKWLKNKHKRALFEALEKVKSELMLLGFISLLLTVGQGPISNICISEKVGNTWHPCSKKQEVKIEEEEEVESPSRRLLAAFESGYGGGSVRRVLAAAGTDKCAAKGKVPFISADGIHQLHIFIFVLAIFHVLYCILTMALGRAKMRSWKRWEKETRTAEYQFSHDPERFRFARDTSFGRRHLSYWTKTPFLMWIVCFFRQFVRSVPKVDYLTLRHGFIMAHLAPQSHQQFNFQKYINRSLEEDFKVVVGISPPIWCFAVIFLLFNTHGWYSYLWLPFIPLIIILLVGTKLQVIITKMGLRIQERGEVVKGTPVVQPGDDLFWFNRPRLILYLINFVLFQNAFQLAFFAWSWYEFSLKSCFHEHIEDIIIRVSMGVLIQILCSYAPHKPNPLLSSSTQFTPKTLLFKLPTTQRPKLSRKNSIFRVKASANPNGSDGFSWVSLTRSIRRGSEQFCSSFGDSLKKETGFDLKEVNVKVGECLGQAGAELERFRTELVPEFVSWNRLEHWKDVKTWEPKRFAALVVYVVVAVVSCQRMYVAIQAPIQDRRRRELTEAYMEAVVPEPSPSNVRKLKKSMWRKTTPKGLRMKKFIEGPDGTLVHDSSYVGEDAWDDEPQLPQDNVKQFIDSDIKLNPEEKKELKEDLGISGQVQEDTGTWRERLQKWKEILQNEKLAEQLDSANSKYVVEFDMKEVENSLRKDVVEKVTETQGTRALWIAKRWWLYRPKLPYTYFLQKLDSSEVAAVVFTEDLKRIYVTMKEGFPLEYVVDIPLDPYLFENISSSGAEVDLLQKRQIHYFMKVVIALVPGLLILWLIRESVMLLHITSKRFLYKKYNQLFDMAYAENFILPVGEVGETKSMSKEVVLGGDVWDLLDELMIYMGNPMQYYERDVKFVRGVLLSGPPGTGKTLFARTLAKESGLPFVFASGAEFTDSEKSGAAKINEMFSIARRNAPCFVFVDEIDAIAGRHARQDPRRRATFEALIAQLDGEKEKTGVDRFSLRQAVIFICATNRPDELDLEFVRSGRIDRRLYIGLPDANQRVQIFKVHSTGKQLAEDVDFEKVVFRTVGFSGADIRNLVNEAAIMSVRKGRSEIYQEDIVDVLDKQLLEGMGVLLTEEEQRKCEQSVSSEKKKLLAVHEAGHILLAHLFPQFDWHAFSQLLPGGKETAVSVFYPREDMVDQGYTTFGYMKMQMVVAHGGRCAERVVYGDDITDGGTDDLEKLTKIAREMVISPQNSRLGLTALTKRIGLMDRPDSPDGELIRYRWEDPNVIPANMTVEVSELFTRELTRYIEETEELAMNGLRNNRHILDMITEELMEKSRITGLEVIEKMKDLSPVMFDDFVKPFQINLEEDGPLPHNDQLRYKPLDIYPAPLHRC